MTEQKTWMRLYDLLLRQAEISFKAGEEAEKVKHIRPFTITEEEKLQNLINKLIEARHDGAKEVVDWIEKNKIIVPTLSNIEINYHEWQFKKKEWGME